MLPYVNSRSILYSCFVVMGVLLCFTKSIHIEPVDYGTILQILHPEYPKGGVVYEAQHHYNYAIAWIAQWLQLGDDLGGLARVIWFLETGLAALALVKICHFLFKNDNLVAAIVVMSFLLSLSGQIDQKTLVRPVFLFAIYYFLQGRWWLAAVLGGLIFHIHIGLGVWWFVPSLMALAGIALIQEKIPFRQVLQYGLIVTAFASPFIYFYLGKGAVHASGGHALSVQYYYYTGWYNSSVLMSLFQDPVGLLGQLFMVMILWVGLQKAREDGCGNAYVLPVLFGVLGLYGINLLFADILRNGSVITLQLLRSFIVVELFSKLFFAFLLARQIKAGRYVFFLVYVLLAFGYGFMRKFFGGNQQLALNIFYVLFLIYETGGFARLLPARFQNSASRPNAALSSPVTAGLIFILLVVPQLPGLKSFVKSLLHLPVRRQAKAWSSNQYLFHDITHFTNENLPDESFLLPPLLMSDFAYYAKHRTFVTALTPVLEIVSQERVQLFEHILKNDFRLSGDELFANYSDKNFVAKWQEIWKNLDEVMVRKWQRKYGLTHVVREKELPLRFPVLYQNPYYIVYEIQ